MRFLEINLLPAEYRKAKTDLSWLFDRRIIWPTMLLIVTLLSGFLVFLHIRDTINALNDELVQVTTQIDHQKPLLEKIKQLDSKLKIIAEKNMALKSIQVSKKRWVILFENISSVLPPNMWISNLNQTGEATLEIKGTTYDFAEVAQYMVSLEQQVSFTGVTLVTITNMKVGDDNGFAFTLNCVINPKLGMETESK